MSRRKTTKRFIEDGLKTHGSDYDYSLVTYVNAKTKVKIICRACGLVFEQTPNNHLSHLKGCPDCGVMKRHVSRGHIVDTSTFIKKASKVHKGEWDYRNSVYVSSRTPIEIICKKHGPFWQTPNRHLAGTRCPDCAYEDLESLRGGPSKPERIIKAFLDKNGIQNTPEYKIPGSRKRFDFYLPDFNTFLEYDGSQHYRGWGGKVKNLLRKQANDKWKNEWAQKNGYNLIRIPHFEDLDSQLENLVQNLIPEKEL